MPATTKNINGALFAAQAELVELEIVKNARGVHSNYVTLDALLDAIVPVLRTHDILLAQPTYENPQGELGLETRLIHVPSETELVARMPLSKLQKNDPQGQGSAITYARRYELMALLGLTADEDDDGQAASEGKEKRKTSSRSRSTSGGDDW